MALGVDLLWGCWDSGLAECVTRCHAECPADLECRAGFCMLPGSSRTCEEPAECVSLVMPVLPEVVCTGDPFEFDVHALGGKPPYEWRLAPRRITLVGDPQAADVTLAGEFPRVDPERPLFTLSVQGSDSCPPAQLTYDLPLYERPSLDGSALPVACEGRPYTAALSATGGEPASYAWRAVVLPPWLELAEDGVLRGTPPAPGDVQASIEVGDAHCGAAPATTFGLSVQAAAACVTIQPAALPAPCVGMAYSAQLTALGGRPNDEEPRYSWSVLTKPAWLDFEPDTQVLSAFAARVTADAALASGTFTVRVQDAAGQTDTRSYDLRPRASCDPSAGAGN